MIGSLITLALVLIITGLVVGAVRARRQARPAPAPEVEPIVNPWRGARTARHLGTGEVAPWLAVDGDTIYLNAWDESLRTDSVDNWTPNY